MPCEDVEFKTQDGLTLRGLFYTPATASKGAKLPCIVMSNGFGAIKEMGILPFAERFPAELPVTVLLYDNRNLGASDGEPRQEVIPAHQIADYSDAITYAQLRPDVDEKKIAVWGTSYSAAHVLTVAAVDRRVKAVISQFPVTDGWTNFHRMTRNDLVKNMEALFEKDRQGRARGEPAITIKNVSNQPDKELCNLPTPDSYEYVTSWMKKYPAVRNEITVSSIEAFRAYNASGYIHHISPTPLLMCVADKDELTPTDIAIESYSRAREPKDIYIFPGGHYDGYYGETFEKVIAYQIGFWKKHFLV
ncbi:DltD N-terminal domain protein [Eremomyces bilateralis CBS 781.70]|uniref:DltD N-terminal domain protein n=1 Tax=Eremomyces bilateralis CBS 781.70 TaxID=1392243 RepID=A0A6G1GFL0_9PEZI|nr:DltD N-terminal domain protein [Eremomyces bilateralis CBS 781.70]KAF1816895.1 DltD N-terminal domain protein [Eremomyces bilateralis CBS 781.70]